MPKYVIERELPGAGKMSPAELKAISEKSVGILKSLGPEIQWVQSYVADDKIYCVYNAKKGDQVEACECSSVCPCVFANDATFADCRGIMAYHIREGHYGSTDLGGINFALVLLKSGKNVPKTMGTWEGAIIVGSNATA